MVINHAGLATIRKLHPITRHSVPYVRPVFDLLRMIEALSVAATVEETKKVLADYNLDPPFEVTLTWET